MNKQNIEKQTDVQYFDKSYYQSELKSLKFFKSIIIGFMLGTTIDWIILCLLIWNDWFLFFQMSAITMSAFSLPLLHAVISYRLTKQKIQDIDEKFCDLKNTIYMTKTHY